MTRSWLQNTRLRVLGKLRKFDVLQNFLSNVPVEFAGNILLRVDFRDDFWYQVARKGYHEYDTHHFFTSYLQPGDSVIDVGAHRGSLTLVAAKRVGSAGQVYAFDIDSDNFEKLKYTLKINDITNVQPTFKAMGDRKQTLSFMRPKNLWGAFCIPRNEDNPNEAATLKSLIENPGDVEEFTCEGSTLDDELLNRITRLDLLKVDVDGPELAVLKGASKLIAKFHPAIICEASIFARDNGIPLESQLEYLWQHGYLIYGTRRSKNNIQKITTAEVPWIQELILQKIDLDLFCYFPGTRDQVWEKLWFNPTAN